MDDNRGVRVGLTVVDADGKRLGKVSRCDAWGFEVVRGFWSPYEWVFRYEEVLGHDGDAIRVARGDGDLLELAEGRLPRSWAAVRLPEAEAPVPATPAEARKAAGGMNVRSPAVQDTA